MSLLSSNSISRVRSLADDEADHNMLQDLHLAAELGKTLLERNKELENCIKKGQCTIDDQAQEIEYLKKQTAAWREANDSRLKIYENLEVNIQDLERANQRLALENTNHKKQIKSQTVTIENLESRLDELQKKFDDISGKYDSLVKEQQEHQQIISKSSDVTDSATYIGVQNSRDGSTQYKAPSPKRMNPEEEAKIQQLINDQDITKLVQQLKDAHYQRAREQKKVEELKDQFEVLIQDLTQKEEELAIWKSKAQDVKNLQDEISTLEEVRQGHLCGRCLRGTDARNQEHLSAMLDQEEEDDELSLAESFAESIAREADANLQVIFSKRESTTTQSNPSPVYQSQRHSRDDESHNNDRLKDDDKSNNHNNNNKNNIYHYPVLTSSPPQMCLFLLCGLLSKTLLYHALRMLIVNTFTRLFNPAPSNCD